MTADLNNGLNNDVADTDIFEDDIVVMTEDPVLAPQPKPAKRNLLPFLAVGILSTLLGAAGGYGLVKAEMATNTNTDSVTTDIRTLETQLATMEADTTLDTRMDALEADIARLSARPANTSDLADLETRINGLEDVVEASMTTALSRPSSVNTSPGRTSPVNTSGGTILPTTLADIERRLSTLEAAQGKPLPMPTVEVSSTTATATSTSAQLPPFPLADVRAALAPRRTGVLSRVIRVRDVETEDTLTALEDALADNDLAAARAAYLILPNDARNAARDWKDALDARLGYRDGK